MKDEEIKKPNFPYLHGFSKEEQDRLYRQAKFTEFSIYQDINFSNCNNVLEVGCGVGAQSEIILRRFPNVSLTGIDLSDDQLSACRAHLKEIPWASNRYTIQKMDAASMDFESKSFDAVFICWVLEHIPVPERVLSEARRVLRPGGRIVVTEVNNSSFFLEPYSPNVWSYWMAFNDHQLEIGGDPFIGLKLGNMLLSSGYQDIKTEIKTWHYDNRLPDRRKAYIEEAADVMMSAASILIKEGRVDDEIVKLAKEELQTVAKDPNAVYHCSYIQAKAKVF